MPQQVNLLTIASVTWVATVLTTSFFYFFKEIKFNIL